MSPSTPCSIRIPRNPVYPVPHKAYVERLVRHWCEMPRAADIDRRISPAMPRWSDAIVGRDPDAAEQARETPPGGGPGTRPLDLPEQDGGRQCRRSDRLQAGPAQHPSVTLLSRA